MLMKIIIIPKLKEYRILAITIFPFIFVRDKSVLEKPVNLNHEMIHSVQQKEMWLCDVTERLLEAVIRRIIDIQVSEVDLPLKAFLHPMHNRGHRLAYAVPESEEHQQLHFASGQFHRVWIASV